MYFCVSVDIFILLFCKLPVCVALVWSFSCISIVLTCLTVKLMAEASVSEHDLLFFVPLSTISVYILSLGPKVFDQINTLYYKT